MKVDEMKMRRGEREGMKHAAMLAAVAAVALLVLLPLLAVNAVDRGNFKTCEQSSFCKRQLLDKPADWASPYSVDKGSVELVTEGEQQILVFDVQDSRSDKPLRATVSGFEDNTIRLTIDEKEPLRPRYRVQDVVLDDLVSDPITSSKGNGDNNAAGNGEDEHFIGDLPHGGSVVVTYAPFRIDFLRGPMVVATFNGRGLFDFEQYRERREDDPDGAWEESFKTHKDSKPHGPSAVAVDLTFHDAQHVYGIPEHADSFSLRQTEREKPYRLYNLDVFEYELEETMALYGSIPYMVSHSSRHTVGALFLNAAEMWVAVNKASSSSAPRRLMRALSSLFSSSPPSKENPSAEERPTTETTWVAESGVVDLFFFLGPEPAHVFRQYARVTGTAELPPLFSLAYHQCRWNYNDQEDVAMVDRQLDQADVPADVIWLDIEHTDGKRYMTWDRTKFPDPAAMQDALNVKERKMVNIVDPHIKRASGYRIHEEAERLGLYVKNKDDKDYDGWCWPGSSSWLDFTNPDVRSWWSDQFALDKYEGTTQSLFFWNDMNEPSVFNGPEVTMHKDAKHFGGWEHRDVHNVYGMWQPAATAEGIRRRSNGKQRPFVLSRAFFAGSQRYGAIWTGDNTADWGHLKASVPMLLSIGVAGLPFCGADIGGFFGNPDTELLVRWYQAGAYQPFMRAHAHLDTKRREPYLLDQPEQSIVRASIRARYQLLPYWYTLFYESARTGMPAMRPLWVEFPQEEDCFAEEATHMVGNALLVAPVTAAGQTSVPVLFPGTQPWYDLETGAVHVGPARRSVAAPLRKMPVFQRGGAIVPRKNRVRRTSGLTHHDPFTLVAALDDSSAAEGVLYVDDYNSYEYATGNKFLLRSFRVQKDGSNLLFTSKRHADSGSYETTEWIERLRIHGVKQEPVSVSRFHEAFSGGEDLSFTFDASSQTLDVKKPSTRSIAEDFSVVIAF